MSASGHRLWLASNERASLFHVCQGSCEASGRDKAGLALHQFPVSIKITDLTCDNPEFRWEVMGDNKVLANPLDSDRIFTSLQASISALERNVKKAIYLGAPNLRFDYPVAHELSKRLWMGTPVESLHFPLKVNTTTIA